MRTVCVAALATAAAGCSLVEVKAAGKTVIGRSMETASPADGYEPWLLATVPRGTRITPAPACGNVMQPWRTTVGYVGVELPVVGHSFEGLNEKGMSVSAHTLRESTYQAVRPGANASQVCHQMFVSWALSQFDSVAALTAGLKSHQIVLAPGTRAHTGESYHWGVQDVSGASAVIEVLDGEVHVHNNTVGVMTNDPPFDWHLRNLNNFVGVQRRWPKAAKTTPTEVGPVPVAVGHGTNLLGIPGDATPPGRFVRMFYLRELARQPKTEEDAMVLAQAIVNSVFVIDGTVAEEEPALTGYDRTMWASLKVLEDGVFMVRSYSSMEWISVKLSDAVLSEGAKVRAMPIPAGISARSVTSQLRPV
eukprot:TRINITY_DN883_c1_g1_i1.p1 TRINITY_DN883_c1_g1~~TRINITY_DN883_c1_g1_i1.p1  ORF type:complete len:363 (+),score=109.57 TRINITY_DN883_c1_g1_i1:166-1254(+)